MYKLVQSLSDLVLNELFYPICFLCEVRTNRPILCENCARFPRLKEPLCNRCGEPTSFSVDECLKCTSEERILYLNWIRSPFWLTEEAKRVVWKAKYGGEAKFLTAFKGLIIQEFRSPSPNAVLFPIPCSFEKHEARGFNQTWMMAKWIQEVYGLPIVLNGLFKKQETPAQSSLSRKERKKNLLHSFDWNQKVSAPKEALLIDDILTTGATLEACARMLKKNGVEKVSAWTLFRTPKEG